MSAGFLSTILTGVAVLVAIGCGSESSPPTAPTPPPPVVTPPPQPPPPPARGQVAMSIVPNPVPFSGNRIDVPGCSSSQNTWFYDQILTETGGSAVTFNQRIDLFDGGRTNDRSDLNIVVPANGSITLQTRWCSQTSVDHTAESRFSGKDAAGNEVSVSSGVVRLMKKPN